MTNIAQQATAQDRLLILAPIARRTVITLFSAAVVLGLLSKDSVAVEAAVQKPAV